jgi:diguanylate cyclase (GGDEF)-like protein
MHLKSRQPRALGSLKQRYILIAGAAAVLVTIGAFLANLYARQVTAENTRSLTYRDHVTAVLGDIRNLVWQADTSLNAILISPTDVQEQRITNNLQQARQQLNGLADHPVIAQAGLDPQLNTLQVRLQRMTELVMELIDKRHDPSWVYPALPFINQKLLEPNVEFETAADQALHEIAQRDGRPYASPLYGEFDEVRDLWRRKILNFRAVVIRFAGLNDMDTSAQELNINNLHTLIQQRLDKLQRLADQGKLGFESELAVERMRQAATRWQANWKTIREIRSSSTWRQDLSYLEQEVRPAQMAVFNALTAMEQGITRWSGANIETVQQATHRISNLLLGFAALALAFVLLVYILIDRSVLRPIAHIANAISNEGQVIEQDLKDGSSDEIHTLVAAFNSMRRQIHQRQMALEHQALHDSLTGLANRNLLQDRLIQAMHIMHRNEKELALLLLDLDRFKEINDTLGHQVGDHLLQQISQRLQNLLRESDTVARLGGDEFAIVAPNTDLNQARIFAEKIAGTLSDVFKVEGQNLYVGVSIGIAIYPIHGTDSNTLIRHADIAMYIAKRNNNNYKLYEPTEDEQPVDQLALVGDLHDELKRPRNLMLHYQPQVDLHSHQIIATEALLRWHHPQMGPISPEHLINMAEHTGLIGALTQWVIETAIEDFIGFEAAIDNLQLSLNLSAWNLQDPNLPDMIQDVLIKHRLSPEKLILEITEGAMMNDPVRARTILRQLSEMGIVLAIDDFGTGFSSLGYLKLLPVSCLKIDKSFVIDMLNDENDAVIVHSTIELAHNLHLQVVAEGVENQATLNRLRALKCDTAQGYYIAEPMTREALEHWLQQHRPRRAQ